ncbi:MAG TPA: type VI secretion system accessory protein TagJ [Candidatus Acidoferrum sp.]|jgi:type VI secretion system protein ImpE|nr:type VI secretion system accessory protein TagJ [Candidatus Acidoferrum sp.]
MNAEQLIKNGQLKEGLTALQQEVRAKPDDQRLRIFLFQVNCVLGQWEKALNQLQVLSSLSAETMMLAQIFQPVLACEMLRREVFAGKRTPLMFGKPMEWMGMLVQANELLAEGQVPAAAALREKAFEAAPATAGSRNGTPFEWIADADSRLGPILEAIVEGKYYWIPFCRIKKLFVPKPSDLRDLVWAPVQFIWANGGEASGHIPCRYSGTEATTDDALRLARKTEWNAPGEGLNLGLGQRVLATDAEDIPLLECGSLELQPLPAEE